MALYCYYYTLYIIRLVTILSILYVIQDSMTRNVRAYLFYFCLIEIFITYSKYFANISTLVPFTLIRTLITYSYYIADTILLLLKIIHL